MLIGYDNYIIYRIYIKDQKKAIRVKDLYIFEDYKIKTVIKLFDYNDNRPNFQGFFLRIMIKKDWRNC